MLSACDDSSHVLFSSFSLKPSAAQNTYLQLLTVQKPSDNLFQCPVKQALKRASRYHRGGIQWQPEKSAIIYVSTSAMWEDKFIDILMIILDHSALHSSTATQHTLVSSRARLASHLSRRENGVLVDVKIKMCEYRSPKEQVQYVRLCVLLNIIYRKGSGLLWVLGRSDCVNKHL